MQTPESLKGCNANPDCTYVSLANKGFEGLNEAVVVAQTRWKTAVDLGSNKRAAADALEQAERRRDAFALAVEADALTCDGSVCKFACSAIQTAVAQATSEQFFK